MKAFSIPVIAGWILVISASYSMAQTETTSVPVASQILSKQELNQAARSYAEGRFAEAQLHSERALALDPNSKVAPMFIARTIHAQFKPGDTSEENLGKAREAISAYQRILARFPKDEEAYKAVAYFYGVLLDEQNLRDWILRRAADTSMESAKRAEAYIVLASRDWDCSFKITELPTSKRVKVVNERAVVRYLMPKEPSDFDQARQCLERGLQMVDMAITLERENQSAWSYKTNILLEFSKLAEMEGNLEQKRLRRNEYQLALKEATRLAEEAQKEKDP